MNQHKFLDNFKKQNYSPNTLHFCLENYNQKSINPNDTSYCWPFYSAIKDHLCKNMHNKLQKSVHPSCTVEWKNYVIQISFQGCKDSRSCNIIESEEEKDLNDKIDKITKGDESQPIISNDDTIIY
eukprot:UN32247